jgi:hypothetical protein
MDVEAPCQVPRWEELIITRAMLRNCKADDGIVLRSYRPQGKAPEIIEKGLCVGNQSFDFCPIVQDGGNLSIRNLDNFVDVFAHPQIVSDHNAGFSIFMD